jgi:hypothetical protein
MPSSTGRPRSRGHDVIGLAGTHVVSVAAVVGFVHRVAGLLQPGTQQRAQCRIVFDEQDSHADSGSPMCVIWGTP